MRLPNIETCQFIPISSLLDFMGKDAFELFKDQMSINYGTANRSLISIEKFKEEIDEAIECFEDEFKIKHSNYLNEYLDELALKSVYIDLEN